MRPNCRCNEQHGDEHTESELQRRSQYGLLSPFRESERFTLACVEPRQLERLFCPRAADGMAVVFVAKKETNARMRLENDERTCYVSPRRPSKARIVPVRHRHHDAAGSLQQRWPAGLSTSCTPRAATGTSFL